MRLLFSLEAFELCVPLVHNITNDDNDDYDDVYMMWILVSSSFLICEYLKTVHVKCLCCTSMTDAFTLSFKAF